MRHRVAGRTFGRRPEQRRALLRGLATSLVTYGRIETTVPKAKEVRRVVEPLVTLAKRGDLHARRRIAAYVYTQEAVSKLFSELATRFKDRTGGYTRILQTGRRRGDGAPLALIEFIPGEKTEKKESGKTSATTKPKKKAAPKTESKKPKADSKKKATTKTKK